MRSVGDRVDRELRDPVVVGVVVPAVTEVAFGFGDVTLATFCGLVVGFPGVTLMLVLMVLLGALFALLYIVSRGLFARGYRAHTPLPYGPSIILAAVIMLLWGADVIRLALGG